MKTRKFFSLTFLVASLLFLRVIAVAQTIIQPPVMAESWSKEYEPFRIAGNLYYIGTYDLASFLIVTQKGNILINTGLAPSVQMIKAHIEN